VGNEIPEMLRYDILKLLHVAIQPSVASLPGITNLTASDI
jgi:hypothetical protein